MDPIVVGLLAATAVGFGAGGAAMALFAGADRGHREWARLRLLAPQAGLQPTRDGRWKGRAHGRSVYLLLEADGGWQLVCRAEEAPPFTAQSGQPGAELGDEAFDARFVVVRAAADPAVWSWLSAGSRGALARLSFHGQVGLVGAQVTLLGDRAPASAADLAMWVADVAAAAEGLGQRTWQEVVDEEPQPVLARALRVLIDSDPEAAEAFARRARTRFAHTPDVALATEVARALRDDAALLELLAHQPDEQAVVRLAQALGDHGLVEALHRAADKRNAALIGGCSLVALGRAEAPDVQVGALEALEAWLAPGALRMPFVEEVAVRLLRVGQHQLGPGHQGLLERMLAVKGAGSRQSVLRIAGERGTAALVPALRALGERLPLTDTRGRARVAWAVERIQGRASGQVGGLALADEGGGGLAVPEE